MNANYMLAGVLGVAGIVMFVRSIQMPPTSPPVVPAVRRAVGAVPGAGTELRVESLGEFLYPHGAAWAEPTAVAAR